MRSSFGLESPIVQDRSVRPNDATGCGVTNLEGCEFNQSFDSSGIGFPALLHLLASLSQAREAKVLVSLTDEAFISGEKDTGNVVLLCRQPKACGFRGLLNLVSDIASNGIADLS
jgi:hypothetical protein